MTIDDEAVQKGQAGGGGVEPWHRRRKASAATPAASQHSAGGLMRDLDVLYDEGSNGRAVELLLAGASAEEVAELASYGRALELARRGGPRKTVLRMFDRYG